MKKIIVLLSLFILTLTLSSCMKNVSLEELQNKELVAVMKTTNWVIEIELEPKLAMKTTYNFVGLAQKSYYDWIIFHRIIKDFMIQWWDPTWTGMWGESIYGEKFEDEFNPELKNNKYTISMANAWPNTNWSQFFINTKDNNFLDNKHSVFGKVISWEKNIDKIEKAKTWENDKPEKEIKILWIEIKERKDWSLVAFKFDIDSYLKELEKEWEKTKAAKKTKKIEAWDTASVHYTWTFEDGTKFDSSLDRWEPIEFQVWAKMMIPWFDAWVVWMKIWEKKKLTLSPIEAYWEKDEKNKQVIPKADLKSFTDAWIKLEVWVKLPTQMWELEIIETTDDSVTIDANHPMAWKTLIFDIEIIDIK